MAAFVRAYPPTVATDSAAAVAGHWFIFHNNRLLVRATDSESLALPDNAPAVFDAPLFLGTLNGAPCLADVLDVNTPLPVGLRAVGLRDLFGRVDDDLYGVAGYATQLLEWRRTSAFCSVCGRETKPVAGSWARECVACAFTRYPPVSPAVLILVHDGSDRVLLAHKPGWGDRFSILAGFVEPGESLEECVIRETAEEVGASVADLVYQGSQPWPFPHQLMIGFTARYTGGALRLDAAELDDARWFSADALPSIPPPLSLSRQIIDRWVASQKKE